MRLGVFFVVASTAACGANGSQANHQPVDGGWDTQTPSTGDGAQDDGGPGNGAQGDATVGGGANGDSGPVDAASGATSDVLASDAKAPDGGGIRCKRGIAADAAPSAAFAPTGTSGISWWYNWSTAHTGGDPSIEFVPMIWGAASLGATLPAGSRNLLGFNEPNFKSQANLTPTQAATDWPQVQAKAAPSTGIAVVGPAVNFCGSASNSSGCSDPTVTDPYAYLKDFFAACQGCKVDYVAVHWYNCDLPSLKAYLEGNTDAGGGLQGFVQFGKPIWLTEFACDGSHSVAQQKAYMQAAVPYLESNPHVVRYAWFSASPIPNALLTNSDGSLNDLGSTYVALPETCQ